MQRFKDAKSKNTIDSESLREKVKRIITEANPKEIEKHILFGEVIKEQLYFSRVSKHPFPMNSESNKL